LRTGLHPAGELLPLRRICAEFSSSRLEAGTRHRRTAASRRKLPADKTFALKPFLQKLLTNGSRTQIILQNKRLLILNI
jgi:hypothetical protein